MKWDCKLKGTCLVLGLMLWASVAGAQQREVYKQVGKGVDLAINIYKPKDWKADDSRAAVVFFFGGGWRGGTTKQFDPHCKRLAERGMVAMTAEYRIKNKHGSPPFESTQDAKSAMRWVRAHASELGIDPEKIAAGGGSAGGHLAAATATIEAFNDKGDDLEISPKPNALLLYNPALDLNLPGVEKSWGKEIAGKIIAISPLQHVQASLPPCIIFHGIADSTVPYATAEAFVKKAKALGAKNVVLIGYADRAHGFFNFGRGGGKDFQSTMKKTEDFLVKLGWIN
ncbi:MAG: alpha/beta hydrolase fold domain-containing protein [Verrucomicrobiota bacterium]